MGGVKTKPFRKVVFTDMQMLLFKEKFYKDRKYTHRDFVERLFKSQHKMAVINHDMLTYQYVRQKNNKSEVVHTIVIVEGQLGRALTAI